MKLRDRQHEGEVAPEFNTTEVEVVSMDLILLLLIIIIMIMMINIIKYIHIYIYIYIYTHTYTYVMIGLLLQVHGPDPPSEDRRRGLRPAGDPRRAEDAQAETRQVHHLRDRQSLALRGPQHQSSTRRRRALRDGLPVLPDDEVCPDPHVRPLVAGAKGQSGQM